MLKLAIICLSALATAASAVALAKDDPAGPAYRPSLGDLMNMTVQPRHLKLGLAGQERNWALAAYQLHELEESFEAVAHLWPKWREVDIVETVKATITPPLEAVELAVKAEDPGRFAESYARLTETCNACHQSAGVGVIVIQIPKSSPFANQDFRPGKH